MPSPDDDLVADRTTKRRRLRTDPHENRARLPDGRRRCLVARSIDGRNRTVGAVRSEQPDERGRKRRGPRAANLRDRRAGASCPQRGARDDRRGAAGRSPPDRFSPAALPAAPGSIQGHPTSTCGAVPRSLLSRRERSIRRRAIEPASADAADAGTRRATRIRVWCVAARCRSREARGCVGSVVAAAEPSRARATSVPACARTVQNRCLLARPANWPFGSLAVSAPARSVTSWARGPTRAAGRAPRRRRHR